MSNKFGGANRAGSAPARRDIPLRGTSRPLFDLQIVRRSRRWKWQVCDQNGVVVLYGRERSRPVARYQGYRALFLLLRASCLSRGALRG